ncbi:MAG TPA: monovalent cation/H(+) antiporter subunit G [Myxococcales bacterium]|nr:monovalent cation/H(+) antiporter subunit G [Myxococcales bacterium]
MHAAVAVLLALTAFFALAGALGVWLMGDVYQKLHYLTLPCSVSVWFLSAAVFVGEKQKQAGAKVVLIGLVLFFMNAVVTQATARAAFVRKDGQWPPRQPPPAPPEAKG